jgi:hypothetical protein
MYTHPILANVAIGLAWGPNSRQTYLTTDFGMSWERIAGNTTFTTTFACEDAACQVCLLLCCEFYFSLNSDLVCCVCVCVCVVVCLLVFVRLMLMTMT